MRTQETTDIPYSWKDFCFSPQGRGRLTQAEEKTVLGMESLFDTTNRKWSLALSAPLWGEKVMSFSWDSQGVELDQEKLSAWKFNKFQREFLKEMAAVMASVLESSLEKKCSLIPPQGSCRPENSFHQSFFYQYNQQGIEFYKIHPKLGKISWQHQIAKNGSIGSGATQLISACGSGAKCAWQLEVFQSSCL